MLLSSRRQNESAHDPGLALAESRLVKSTLKKIYIILLRVSFHHPETKKCWKRRKRIQNQKRRKEHNNHGAFWRREMSIWCVDPEERPRSDQHICSSQTISWASGCWVGLLVMEWFCWTLLQQMNQLTASAVSIIHWKDLLKLQYFGHLMWRGYLLEKTLIRGKIEGKRRRGQKRVRWLDVITDSTRIWANSRKQWRTEQTGVLPSTGLQRVGRDLVTQQQQLFL